MFLNEKCIGIVITDYEIEKNIYFNDLKEVKDI